MPSFRYEAIDKTGSSIAGMLEAPDRKTAVARLQADGLLPAEVTEVAPAPLSVERKGKPPPRFPLFVRQLTTLVGAGVPLERALGLVATLERRGPAAAMAQRLRNRLRGGSALSAALAAEDGMDPVAVAMVEAGEASGKLDEALERLAVLLERSETLAQSVRSALIYPTTLLVVAIATVFILMVFVLPRFGEMFVQAGQELPVFTRLLLDASAFLGQAAPFLIFAVLMAWVAVRLALRRPGARVWFDHLRYGVPLLGQVFLKMEVERVLRVLGGLVAGGVPLPRAVDLAAGAGGAVALDQAVTEAARRVREGRSLGEAFEDIGWFPILGVELARIGEETGRLAPMLIQAADIYDREVRTETARLVALLPPALTIALGVVVGAIVLALISSVVDLYAIVE